MDLFFFKKIVSPFFMPLPVCLLLALLGLFCLWFTRKQKTGKVLLTISTLLFGLLSYDAVTDMLVKPLEDHPPFRNFDRVQEIKWIVVLGGGSGVDKALPLSTYLCEASLKRVSEGVFIHNRIPESKLIMTGRSRFAGITPVAEVMALTAVEWGVDGKDIIVEDMAADTKDHVIYVKEIVGEDSFILVTSASHMPRAMGLFRKQGVDPIPAPTDYMVKEQEGGLTPGRFFPSAGSLERAGRAVHEYLGVVWGKIRKQF